MVDEDEHRRGNERRNTEPSSERRPSHRLVASQIIRGLDWIRDPARWGATRVARLAVAAIAIGVFLTWVTDGPVSLGGLDGPNDGWLVLIVSAFALGWIPSMSRTSWIGTIGVLGAAAVILQVAVSTLRESRDVLDGSIGFGLIVVLIGAIALAASAASTAVTLVRRSRRVESPR